MSPRTFREILVYFKDDLMQQFRSARSLILLGSYLLFNVVLTLPYLALSEFIGRQLAGDNPNSQVALQGVGASLWAKVFTSMTGSVEEGLAIAQIPMPALYTFAIASFVVPLLVVLTTSDIVAEDLRSGHVRYLTLRSSRASMLWGRMLSRTTLLAVTVFSVTMGCFLLFWWKLEGLPDGSLQHFLRFGLLLAAMVPTYAAFAGLCSALVKSPFFALLLGIFLLLVFGVLSLAAASTVGYAVPNSYKILLMSPMRWWQGLLIYLGFGAVYASAAYARLRWRDI